MFNGGYDGFIDSYVDLFISFVWVGFFDFTDFKRMYAYSLFTYFIIYLNLIYNN
jgi:hypothetical protein